MPSPTPAPRSPPPSVRQPLPRLACLTLALAAALFPKPVTGADPTDVLPQRTLTDLPNAIPASPALIHSLTESIERLAERPPPVDAAAWQARRPAVARALRQALGLHPLPERTPLHAQVLATNHFGPFWVENVLFESRPGFWVTANVYRPAQPATGRLPAVLSPIGHFLSAGKTATDVQARCQQLARLGFVVLTYDAIGQGERMFAGNIHHDAGYALLPLGETVAGWMIWDSLRALDYLETRDDVDPARIGLTGNSGGGLNTLFTAALDERIRAAAVVGFTFDFANWAKYGGAHCTCTHLPGAFRDLQWFEIAGLIAPRAVMMLQGENDGIFPIAGARASGENVERLFRLLGLPAHARFVSLPGLPHAYSQRYRETMYGWMLWHLQGQGRGDPWPEPSLAPLPEKDRRLLCDPDRRLLPQAPTVVDLARRQALARVDAIARDPAAQSSTQLVSWAGTLVAPPTDRPHYLSPKIHRTEAGPQATLERISFNSEDGLRLTALLWIPTPAAAQQPAIVWTDSRGKSTVANHPARPALLAAGYPVLAVDLRGQGEGLDRYSPSYNINFRLTANQILLGRPLPGRRAFDLQRAIDYLGSRTDCAGRGVIVIGAADNAVPALLAATVDPRIQHLALTTFPPSFAAALRARTPPAPERFGDAWNDPQLRGTIDVNGEELDFGAAIPSSLLVTDIPTLLRGLAPRHVLLCQTRGQTDPDYQRFLAPLQTLANARRDHVQFEPLQPLENQLITWLAALPPP